MTPNLLVIMSDEHQSRAMGCAGHPFVKTPNLDQLAARGTRFTNAYTPSPICVPARASFATGKYVHQTRLWDNAMPYTGAIPGWGHALQAKGVPVESIGKLHYRSQEDPAGFDVEHIPMNVVGGVGMVWASIRQEDERISPGSRMLGDYIGPGNSKYTDYDASVTSRTCKWLADRAEHEGDQPWCLYVGLVAPHFPLVVPHRFYDLYPTDELPDTKLRPHDGYQQHPWIAKQDAVSPTEDHFTSDAERLAAMASYYGLCSYLDWNVGEILTALERNGLSGNTTVVYTSDHGDNLGARGLWGKSNLYQESVSIPMIMAGPDVPKGLCETPVSLLDLSRTIAHHFDTDIDASDGVRSLYGIADDNVDEDRIVFSEYHAIGAVSGAFMLRKGKWKLNHYVGFIPELFNLENDPEELTNLAANPYFASVLGDLMGELTKICDPTDINQQAFNDQAALISSYGGRDAALKLGAPGATPPPKVT